MSDNLGLNFVYKRRKLQGKFGSTLSAQNTASTKKSIEDSVSFVSSDTLSAAVKLPHVVFQLEDKNDAVGTPILPPLSCNTELHIPKMDLMNRLCSAVDLASDETLRGSRHKIIEVDSTNDSCSSSKSTIELVSPSVKTEMDDTGECSSSSVVVVEARGKDLSEKDLCLSLIRSHGVLDGVGRSRTNDSVEGICEIGCSMSSRSCKICSHAESTSKMLICDNCEEAFHLSCCSTTVKRIPMDEWFCHSCMKKKRILLKEAISGRAPSILGEMGRCRNDLTASESNPIELMLRDPEPYTTAVRVGKGFQADIPEWLGPIKCADAIQEPLEMDSSDFRSIHGLESNTPTKIDPICNWLQCREVICGADGVNETVCGKWRRAPLFEVQTDDWECFCSVPWDPIHADCAVPQELETDQVLKQLNYVRMLRPRLAAQRRKLVLSKYGVDKMRMDKRT